MLDLELSGGDAVGLALCSQKYLTVCIQCQVSMKCWAVTEVSIAHSLRKTAARVACPALIDCHWLEAKKKVFFFRSVL